MPSSNPRSPLRDTITTMVASIGTVACFGLLYTAQSVVNEVHALRMEQRLMASACREAATATMRSDVLKELPHLSAWYSKACAD